MPISEIYNKLATIALDEFQEIVIQAQIIRLPTSDPLKLRLDLVDGSFLDVYLSPSGRYSYHWERRPIGKNETYRHDNAPHLKWHHVSTFPRHFHNGSPDHVVESHISHDPEQAIREFLTFIEHKLSSEL